MDSSISVDQSSIRAAPRNQSFYLRRRSAVLRRPSISFPHKTLKPISPIKAAASPSPNLLPLAPTTPVSPLKAAVCAVIFTAATFSKLSNLPQARATVINAPPSQTLTVNLHKEIITSGRLVNAVTTLRGTLNAGMDVLGKLSAAEFELKFIALMALNEIRHGGEARENIDEILARIPPYMATMFGEWQCRLDMDLSKEAKQVERDLKDATRKKNVKKMRDLKLKIAQLHFFNGDFEAALTSYGELVEEDPSDYRPYFCRAMMYRKLGEVEMAKEEVTKYMERSQVEYDEEGCIRTPWLKIKLIDDESS